jgi:two-component system response regulator AtoC
MFQAGDKLLRVQQLVALRDGPGVDGALQAYAGAGLRGGLHGGFACRTWHTSSIASGSRMVWSSSTPPPSGPGERKRLAECAMSYATVDDRRLAAQGEDSCSPPLVLVVMSPSGTGSFPVPAHGSLVLGRAVECDVCIEDTKLSRRHAELRCGATIAWVDLDSRNGSYVQNERVPANVPVPLRVGDAIAIGSTLLTLQRAAGGERPRHVWSHGYFEARVEEECARAARGGAPFAILRLRLVAERADAPTRDSSAAAQLGGPLALLDAADMLASYAPHEYEALFTRTAAPEADTLAAVLEERLGGAGASSGLSVAAYPRDGRTPEALIEHTSRGLRERSLDASEQAPASTRGAIDRMELVISRVAAGIINVLVLGETGVGKDVLVRRIHELSPRAKMPLVSINCGALSETLLEGELFGHEKGAFTGALHAKQGLLESANGGTVFLDEIGEMPLALQVKLLRVLEQREVMRVGAVRPRIIDVRFMAATNRNLESEIAEGRFRQDLYFRLNGISLSLPPLRERTEEIGPLALAFTEQVCRHGAARSAAHPSGCDAGHDAVPVAREHPRAPERDRASDPSVHRRSDHARAPSGGKDGNRGGSVGASLRQDGVPPRTAPPQRVAGEKRHLAGPRLPYASGAGTAACSGCPGCLRRQPVPGRKDARRLSRDADKADRGARDPAPAQARLARLGPGMELSQTGLQGRVETPGRLPGTALAGESEGLGQ